MNAFPEETFEDPEKAAGFLTRLGYDPENIARTLTIRFGVDEEDARRIAENEARDHRSELDRAAVEAEHDLDS